MENYFKKISQLSGLFTAFVKEIELDEDLKQGEKFLILQQLMSGVEPANKSYEKQKSKLKTIAENLCPDDGTGKTEPVEFEGAEIFVKYSYPKPTLDSEKLKTELQRAYSEIGVEFTEETFLKKSTVRKTVIIQSILDK
jgi:hypothetical protein